jgi:hypothetical protein
VPTTISVWVAEPYTPGRLIERRSLGPELAALTELIDSTRAAY